MCCLKHVCELFGQGYDVEELIAEADGDGTGGINLEDFSKHMRKRCGLMIVFEFSTDSWWRSRVCLMIDLNKRHQFYLKHLQAEI